MRSRWERSEEICQGPPGNIQLEDAIRGMTTKEAILEAIKALKPVIPDWMVGGDLEGYAMELAGWEKERLEAEANRSAIQPELITPESNSMTPLQAEEDGDDAWLTRVSYQNIPRHEKEVKALLSELEADFPVRHLKEYKHQATQLLINVLKAEDDDRGLAVSRDQNKKKGIVKAQNEFGFTFRILRALLSLLEEEELIDIREGRRGIGDKKGRTTQIRATKKLIDRLCPDGLHYDHFPNHISVEFRFDDDGRRPQFSWSHPAPKGRVPEMDRLDAINVNLRKHSWPMKGPIKRIYNYDIMQGGRIQCRFQGMKKTWKDPLDPTKQPEQGRLYRHRDFRIDGQEVVEIDIKSCHLRMASHIAGVDVGRDPYQEIADQAGCSRNAVKAVMTNAFGARTRLQAQRAVGDQRKAYKGLLVVPKGAFEAVVEATEKLYPNVELFIGHGMLWFTLEGSIMLDVIEKALTKGIPVLPLHDAVICPEANEKMVTELLIEAWMENLNTPFRPEVEVIRYKELL